MVHVSAPGKLMIAGEWSVLEPGNPCIVASINKRVHAEIRRSSTLTIELKDSGVSTKGSFENSKLKWDSDNEELAFAKASVETVFKYLGSTKPFRLVTYGSSDVSINGKKLGFGSSAAATVAMVAAILRDSGRDITEKRCKQIIYKLSTIANYIAQGRLGSSFDIASSTYGGVIVYERFDPKWLGAALQSSEIPVIVEEKWPGLKIESLAVPEDFRLLVGFSGKSASTTVMIRQMKEFKMADSANYVRIMAGITNIVQDVIKAWKNNDKNAVIALLRENEQKLRELTGYSKVGIETEELRKLSELASSEGCAGKLSGAGGGDCAIAVSFDEKVNERIHRAWSKDFVIVDAAIDEGVREEK